MPVASDIKIRANGQWISLRNQKLRADGAWKNFGKIRANGQWYEFAQTVPLDVFIVEPGNVKSSYPDNFTTAYQKFRNEILPAGDYATLLKKISVFMGLGQYSNATVSLYRGDENSTDLVQSWPLSTTTSATGGGDFVFTLTTPIAITPLQLFTIKITKNAGYVLLGVSTGTYLYNYAQNGILQTKPLDIYALGTVYR